MVVTQGSKRFSLESSVSPWKDLRVEMCNIVNVGTPCTHLHSLSISHVYIFLAFSLLKGPGTKYSFVKMAHT